MPRMLVVLVPICVLTACRAGNSTGTTGTTSDGSASRPATMPAVLSDAVDVFVGKTYCELVDILGEPRHSLGFGEIHAVWQLADGRWLIPVFEGDRVTSARIEKTDPFEWMSQSRGMGHCPGI